MQKGYLHCRFGPHPRTPRFSVLRAFRLNLSPPVVAQPDQLSSHGTVGSESCPRPISSCLSAWLSQLNPTTNRGASAVSSSLGVLPQLHPCPDGEPPRPNRPLERSEFSLRYPVTPLDILLDLCSARLDLKTYLQRKSRGLRTWQPAPPQRSTRPNEFPIITSNPNRQSGPWPP